MRKTLLMAVISFDCWNGVKKVDILRGGNAVFLNYTVEIIFLCENSLTEDG
jgi:F0F1-type ATP synthase assembly protein I